MSQQTEFPFIFGKQQNAAPFDFGAQTINPADLHRRRPDDLPAQRPLGLNMAAQQLESTRAPLPQQTNRPANILEWQGAYPVGGQYQMPNNMAAPQQENQFARNAIPENDAGFFPAQQPAAQTGPGVRFAPVSPERRMELAQAAKRNGERKKLGPRSKKRSAEDDEDESAAAAVAQPGKKSRRPGPRAAGPNQRGYNWCFKEHQRSCDAENRVCCDDCPLRKDWSDEWRKKDEQKKELGGRWVTGLWWHLYENADNRKDGRRRAN